MLAKRQLIFGKYFSYIDHLCV